MRKTWLVAAALLAGCSSTTENPRSCLDGYCSEAAYPFCDTDGSIGGTKFECVAVACTAGDFGGCREGQALSCHPDGTTYNVEACEFGCDENYGGCLPCEPGTPTCGSRIVPKYLPEVCETFASAPTLVVEGDTAWNTNDEALCNGGVVDQQDAPQICVVRYGEITIARSANLVVIGDRAIALVSDGRHLVDGVLNVGSSTKSGPGGGYHLSLTATTLAVGDGGAGFKTAGGAGGSGTADGGAANGAPPAVAPALLDELVGGTSTRNNYISSTRAGGAATLISCRGEVEIRGLVDANGDGGIGGGCLVEPCTTSGGGGSGGHVAIQGMRVTITGELYANGGSGAGGFTPGSTFGAKGRRGERSSNAAAGPVGSGGGGNGGNGGAATTLPGSGTRPTTGSSGIGGAGGGSVGFFHTFTPDGVTPLVTPRVASPAVEPNRTLRTR